MKCFVLHLGCLSNDIKLNSKVMKTTHTKCLIPIIYTQQHSGSLFTNLWKTHLYYKALKLKMHNSLKISTNSSITECYDSVMKKLLRGLKPSWLFVSSFSSSLFLGDNNLSGPPKPTDDMSTFSSN